MDPIALTAQTTAAARARESRRADRLFDDPLAAILAGEEGADASDSVAGGAARSAEDASVAIRTRFLDDTIGRVTDEQHID